MNCTQAQERLDDLLLAQPDEILPTEVAKHIAVCQRCRIEYEGHTGPCGQFCHHGMEQDYGHKHLKKYATLVEEE